MAPRLLFPGATLRRRKETAVLHKQIYKVMAPIPKRDGGYWWMRCGSAHVNKDNSINVYLDVIPKDFRFTLRELDEEDLRRRETSRPPGGEAAPPAAAAEAATA
jgi:hypothetical protein